MTINYGLNKLTSKHCAKTSYCKLNKTGLKTFIFTTISEKVNLSFHLSFFSVNIYLLKFNNRNTRKRCKISSKLKNIRMTSWRRSGVFSLNFKHISLLNFTPRSLYIYEKIFSVILTLLQPNISKLNLQLILPKIIKISFDLKKDVLFNIVWKQKQTNKQKKERKTSAVTYPTDILI